MAVARESVESLNVCIYGSDGVGKSALAVRLLTNRYISSYIRNSPTITSSRRLQLGPPGPTAAPPVPQLSTPVSKDLTQLTVRDVSAADGQSGPSLSAHLDWGQCHIVVCARNDRASLAYAARVLDRHHQSAAANSAHPSPIVLVASKADLPEEDKALSLEECHELALKRGCLFFELSVLESPVGSRLVLMALVSELLKMQQQQGTKRMSRDKLQLLASTRKFWMKVFGALFKSICSPQPQNV